MKWQDIPDWAFPVAESILNNVRLKDMYTYDHCMRVGRQARKLARAVGMNDYEQRLLEFTGIFHDIGKVGIPEGVLLKPGRLDENEVEMMKSHPEMSAQIILPLAKEKFFNEMIDGIRCHHERFDGGGYPFKLINENIPLEARVLSVVDTVDAMMYTRPYRQAMGWERIQQELIDCSGTQFDPAIVKIYLQSVRFFGQADFVQEKHGHVVEFIQRKTA